MHHSYLKKALKTPESDANDVRGIVEGLLAKISVEGEEAVRELARKFDRWDGNIVVSEAQLQQAEAHVPDALKRDIQFAHDNIRRLAEAQLETTGDCTVEIVPGFTVGQKLIPIQAAGCYIPGGRYSHLASAIMTVTTAKVAGVKHITAVSPPREGVGIPSEILYTLNLCGADRILNLGGVQGIAAMAQGLFGCQKAAILVGPGNQFVAEAKRILFGEVGIDMFAGPTDSLIIADTTADVDLVAADLVGQAEHGYKSAGPNHVLPTSGAAWYTGGLSLHKFIKTVTWQRPRICAQWPRQQRVFRGLKVWKATREPLATGCASIFQTWNSTLDNHLTQNKLEQFLGWFCTHLHIENWRGAAVALMIAATATFLSEHYGAPTMLFALLIGLSLGFLASVPILEEGLNFTAKTVLRLGVGLLA